MYPDLNVAQNAAVLHRGGPLLVFAGAGSGKTRVITRRIAHAIEMRWYDPWSIVALTFTNKAAREMNERVCAQAGGVIAGLTVGTFHSTSAKWLRFYGPRFGHTGDFVIYDTDDQMSLIRRVLDDMKIDSSGITPRAVSQRIDRAKNAAKGPRDIEPGFDELGRVLPQIYARYEQALLAANALDFGDLVLHLVRLLEQVPEAKRFFNDRFRMLLVDEYQDTNHVQFRLLRNLADGPSPELCVVGDDDQSIYKFRGADVGNILAFRRDYADVAVVKLEQNYRSRQAILNVSNSVIKNNARREPKVLQASRGEGDKPELYVHFDEREEAMAVARRCVEWVSAGGSLKEISVLFRTNAQSRVLEEAFSRARIPFLLVGGQRFYERAEVKDVLAYLRALVHPQSEIDLLRVINTPTRGIGNKTVERMLLYAGERAIPFWDVVTARSDILLQEAGLATGAVEKVAGFAELMRSLREDLETLPPPRVVQAVLTKTRLIEALKSDGSVESESRLKNLGEFMNAVAEWYAARPDGTLTDYLEELALVADVDKLKGSEERVTLMTLHSAKGLEWKFVQLIGLEDGMFPSVRDGESDYEEERRLFYVGVTRAMDRLILSACQSRLMYGQREVMEPSRFLLEIPPALLRRGSTCEQRPPAASPPLSARPATTHPSVGRRARHGTFGEGQVVAVSNDDGRLKYIVEFPAFGRKTVVAQFVQII